MSDSCDDSCGCHDDNDVQGKIKWEYLRTITDTVGIINKYNEYEIIRTKHVKRGSIVYIVQKDESVRKALVI